MSDDINQDDWNGVYYEKTSGEFFLINITPDGVELQDPFTGQEHETLGFAEFEDLTYNDEYNEVSPSVVRDPAATIEQLLQETQSAVGGPPTEFKSYWDTTDVEFAITATNLSIDDDAPYLDTLN